MFTQNICNFQANVKNGGAARSPVFLLASGAAMLSGL
jgi:hypothetical protein